MNLQAIEQQPKEFILKYSIPSIIAMLLTSLVTIVDGLFISNYVGKEALSAIHLGLPVLYIFLGLAIMIGVGGVSMAGQNLGKSDQKRAINIFNQTYSTTFGLMTFMAVLCSFLLSPVIQWFNLDGALTTYFIRYYRIILLIYPLMMMNIVSGMFIRGEGKPQIFMLITILINTINVVLDYIFIAKLNLGVKGAALASAIAISLGFLFMVIYFLKRAQVFTFRRFQFSKTDMKNMILNGSSELIGQLSFSITNFMFNAVVLNKIGVSGIAAMTLAGYAGYAFNMLVIGFGQGTSPMISFSHGAGNHKLSITLKDQTVRMVTGVGIILYALLAVLAPGYSFVFTKDALVSSYMLVGLRIYGLSFILVGYNVLNSFFFTATGCPKESAVISAARGLVIISVLILILPNSFGMMGVWLVAPLTELLTAFIAYYYSKHQLLRYKLQV